MNCHHCTGVNSILSPQETLNEQVEKWKVSLNSEEFARKLDENDDLHHLRDEFYYPKKGTLPKGMLVSSIISLSLNPVCSLSG